MAKQRAKPVKAIVKLQISAGKATPAPPVGTALGPHGVSIMDFCKAYNEQTASAGDMVVPVEVTIYTDRTFSFVLKTPPVSDLIKQALGIGKGSAKPGREMLSQVLTEAQIQEIVRVKMPDLNTTNVEQAANIVAGSARSMGIKVVRS